MRIVRMFACLFILVMLTGFQAEAQRKKKHDPEKAQETIAEFKKVDTGIANFFWICIWLCHIPIHRKRGNWHWRCCW